MMDLSLSEDVKVTTFWEEVDNLKVVNPIKL